MILCSKFYLRAPVRTYLQAVSQQYGFYSPLLALRMRSCLQYKQKLFLKSCSYLPRDYLCERRLLDPITHRLNYLNDIQSKQNSELCTGSHLVRHYCSTGTSKEPEKKLSLLQKLKQMYKEYWYVLVPVHLITSGIWFSSFYYLVKSGVDIASILETIGAGENLVHKLRNSNSTMGYIAVSYALYKIATPLRYTVTLGGTTISINYLKEWGYIKPIPPRDKLKEMLHEKKDILNVKKDNLKEFYKNKGYLQRGIKKDKPDEG